VLAGLRSRDARLDVDAVRTGVVEQPHARIGDERAPVGDVLGEAEFRRSGDKRVLGATRDRD
jgi:hypothetical protein